MDGIHAVAIGVFFSRSVHSWVLPLDLIKAKGWASGYIRLGSRFHVSQFCAWSQGQCKSFTFTFDVHVATSTVTMGIGSDGRIQINTAPTV